MDDTTKTKDDPAKTAWDHERENKREPKPIKPATDGKVVKPPTAYPSDRN